LRFAPTIATYIRERIWHPSQQITEQPDGSVELEFETAGWKELVRWILSWHPDVEVLEPLRLRERIREKLNAIKFGDLNGLPTGPVVTEHRPPLKSKNGEP
jgi:predicted DNA-binding transcriptional regulator YafY